MAWGDYTLGLEWDDSITLCSSDTINFIMLYPMTKVYGFFYLHSWKVMYYSKIAKLQNFMTMKMSRRMTKLTKWPVPLARTQISLGIHPVWSESLLCSLYVVYDPMLVHTDSKAGYYDFVVRWLNSFNLLSRLWKIIIIWATAWENLFMLYANNKGADQPAPPHSLISTFVVRCLDSIISLVSILAISCL